MPERNENFFKPTPGEPDYRNVRLQLQKYGENQVKTIQTFVGLTQCSDMDLIYRGNMLGGTRNYEGPIG